MKVQGDSTREMTGEVARVLEVLGTQLAHSIQESTREWAHVGAAFDRLALANSRLGRLAQAQPEPLPAAILTHNEEIHAALAAAVVALQHHDRLAQRLGHIQAGIELLRDLLSDGSSRSAREWQACLGAVERLQREEHARLAAAESLTRGSVELFGA